MTKHLFSAILFFICLLFAPLNGIARADIFHLIIRSGVTQNEIDNINLALNTTSEMIKDYGFVLNERINVVITSDKEDYKNALIEYFHYSEALAEKEASISGGESSTKEPIVIIRGSDRLDKYKAEAFRVLPHEIFHQIQRQYGKQTNVPIWFEEGTPEAFRYIAQVKAGITSKEIAFQDPLARLNMYVKLTHNSLPNPETLNEATWRDCMSKKVPVYSLATLMVLHLTGDNFSKIQEVYRLMHENVSWSRAFTEVFDVTPNDFYKDVMEKINFEIEHS
ncbi:hypothetical protein V4762_00955 [Thermodesulfobium sp. 4217-1]|uniref:hypothetical protein n=1 Tax=Thermodesulfobium sp. 4217-1 TaxID=3120013 RepID=UPI003221F12B